MTHRFWRKHFHGKIRFWRKHSHRKNDLSEFLFARDSPRARVGKHRIAPFVVPEIHSENSESKLACAIATPSVGKGNNESCTDQFHQKIDNSLFHFTFRRVFSIPKRLFTFSLFFSATPLIAFQEGNGTTCKIPHAFAPRNGTVHDCFLLEFYETFFSKLDCELIRRNPPISHQMRSDLFDFCVRDANKKNVLIHRFSRPNRAAVIPRIAIGSLHCMVPCRL